MSSSTFQFKEFTIVQHHSALKVGTDGVLLGSWAPVEGDSSVLDVGCGTGLIALMVAQRNLALNVVGLDISANAILDATQNVNASPWSNRVSLYQISFQEFAQTCNKGFSHIVSNPPFFNNSLKSDNSGKNLARHDDSLSFEELISLSAKLLLPSGKLSVIIPYDRTLEFLKCAKEHTFYLSRCTSVYSTQHSLKPIRSLITLSLSNIDTIEDALCIEVARHHYTPEYISLTKPFYLKF